MTLTDVRPDEICFGTSGSTGPPRQWFRASRQMDREVDMIAGSLIGPVDMVINYSPPRHLFGALFGHWFPRAANVPVVQAWTTPFEFPRIVPGSRVLVVCVPLAWHLLSRNWRSLRVASSVVALHSAAAPPAFAHEFVREAAPLLRAHEILGSTETGGIAHRPVGAGTVPVPWRGFPDVSFIRDGRAAPGRTEELVVESPRVARPENLPAPPVRWVTGDLVEYTGQGTFRLVGRTSSLVKVNGQRIHLEKIDKRLSECLSGAESVAVAVPGDDLAGEGYAVFFAPGDSDVNFADIRRALRDFPSPMRIVRLVRIPTTASGKPDTTRLVGLLPPIRLRVPEGRK